ncbi:Lin1244/Lin1753 domain-containing protein [Lacticaseibacillus rhamnosus]|uniref:Lin1244/Lin1753 domain-containing protein n=1 Tax=Lacticaseibacillus rhamnosus TaxID=47715 RepID=UPI003DA44E1B
MARPVKEGLDYFPFDVDFATNEKTEAITGEFGPKGVLIFIYLLAAIYRKGYYLEWTELAKNQLVNRVSGATGELVGLVVKRLTEYGTFNKDLFLSDNVLTSQRIQETFTDATKRRKSQKPTLYWINADNNSSSNEVNADINTQSKVKESKVNKTKRQQTTAPVKAAERPAEEPSSSSLSILDICNFWEGNGFGQLSPFTRESLVDWVADMRKAGSPEPEKLVLNALRTAVESNVRNYKYVNGILKNWESKRLLTVAAVEANDSERKTNQPQRRYGKPVRTEKLPSWAEPGYKPEHKKVSAEDRAELAEQLQKLRALGEKN